MIFFKIKSSNSFIFYKNDSNLTKNLKSLMTSFEEIKCISVGFSCQDIFRVNEGWIFAKKEKKDQHRFGRKKKFFAATGLFA